jgi:hypothetical protein
MGYADKDKQREYQRKYVAKNRAEWLAENGPCIVCGSSENVVSTIFKRHGIMTEPEQYTVLRACTVSTVVGVLCVRMDTEE